MVWLSNELNFCDSRNPFFLQNRLHNQNIVVFSLGLSSSVLYLHVFSNFGSLPLSIIYHYIFNYPMKNKVSFKSARSQMCEQPFSNGILLPLGSYDNFFNDGGWVAAPLAPETKELILGYTDTSRDFWPPPTSKETVRVCIGLWYNECRLGRYEVKSAPLSHSWGLYDWCFIGLKVKLFYSLCSRSKLLFHSSCQIYKNHYLARDEVVCAKKCVWHYLLK